MSANDSIPHVVHMIDELPQAPRPDLSGIQYVMRYSVPVFVAPAPLPDAKVIASNLAVSASVEGGQYAVQAHNPGNYHAQISRLALEPAGITDSPTVLSSGLIGYVLPGATMRWTTGSVVHPDDLPEVIAKWTAAVKAGEDYTNENRLRRADGVYRWFHARTIPRRDDAGRIVRWYSLLTDIEELRRLKDRLHEENVALREQIEREFMFEEIVGASPALLAVLANIVKVAPTDSSESRLSRRGSPLNSRAIRRCTFRPGLRASKASQRPAAFFSFGSSNNM